MPDPTDDPPPPPPSAGTLNYRSPGPQPASQWLTDEQAAGTCLVYVLALLTVGGTVLGLIGWMVWSLVGYL